MKEAKELEILTTLDFDKQDVVTVAMARIEGHIRTSVRESKQLRDSLTAQVNEAKEKIEEIGRQNTPKVILNKVKAIQKAFAVAGISKMLTVKSEHLLIPDSSNQYTLFVGKLNENTNRSECISLINEMTPYSKAQKDLVEKIEKLEDLKRDAISDGVNWRAKLSDMTALERHMRAKVVEAQLNKTTEGRALIDILTRDFEKTIKLLEM